LAIARKHLDPPHSDLARYLNNLGVALKQQGAYAEAARVHQQALSMRRAVFGDNHPAVIESLNNLATLRYTQGRVDQAIQRMRAVHEACHAHLGPNHPRTAVSGNNLAVMLSEQGRHAAAVPFYRDAVPTYTGAFEAGHPRVVKLKTRLAESLVALERFTAADSLLTATHQAMQAAESPDSTSLSLLHTHLVDLYEAWGKPEQAKRYRLAQQSSGEAER
jgi:tetratricopeptide (TPR) repeat protein